jgi:hypothetical protein
MMTRLQNETFLVALESTEHTVWALSYRCTHMGFSEA